MEIKPFIRWAGGKQKQFSQLKTYFPDTDEIECYYEPFIGGGTMFLNTLYNQSYISDINRHLINVYEKIKQNPTKVFNHLKPFYKGISSKKYYSLREEYNEKKYSFTYKQAATFIILNKSSFNGVFRVNQKGEYNVPFGKEKPSLPSLESLKIISDKLENTTINCHSFELIRTSINDQDFVYLDPPYPPISDTAFFQHYTKDRFHLNEQEKVFYLFEYLSNRNIMTLISYPDLPIIRETYSDFNIEELPTYRSVRSKGKVQKIKELVIRNY